MVINDPWLQKFFESRNMDGPDGRMLYAYRLTGDEYSALRNNLETWVAASNFNQQARRNVAFCARFVLFASEWWHREYSGGAWRWEPIIERVSGTDDVDIGCRTTCVENGFAFWGHRTDGVGKKYLGAIVAHGGLPLRALGQGIGNVSKILRDCIRLATQYGWQEDQLIAAVAERAEGLPETLRKDEIYCLLVAIVLTALELRREYALAAASDPIAVLQARDPKWMERFPISLEEGAVRPLLTTLVKEAAAQKAVVHANVFCVRRSLLMVSDGLFELQATLSVPRQTSAEAMSGVFGIPVDSLPGYFSIDLAEGEPWLEGRRLLGQANNIRLDGRSRVLRGGPALEEQNISLRQRAVMLGGGPCLVPGGNAMPNDQPWVFAEREGEWVLVAAGGARLPDSSFRIALPTDWALVPDEADCEVEGLGCVRTEESEMQLYEVSGSVYAESAGERFHIRSGQGAKLTGVFLWAGHRLQWQPKRYPAFLGMPTLYRVAEDGLRTRIPAAQIIWRSTSGTRSNLQPPCIQGLVEALYIEDGEVQTRTRMLILSESARIDFASSQEINAGSVRFHGFGRIHVSALSSDISADCESLGEALNVCLRAKDVPPESVLLSVELGGRELNFSLPFPCSGGRFFDRNARIMQDRERLSMHDLEGCRLRIFDQNPVQPKRYALNLFLKCREREARFFDEEIPLPLPQNGVTEFRLIDIQRTIKAMLSFSDELDARVRLSLMINDRVDQSIDVSRYAGHLRYDEQGLLSLATQDLSHTDIETLHSVRLLAAPLLHSDLSTQELAQETSEGILTATWRTEKLDADKSPWLIYPASDSSLLVRPLVWVPTAVELSTDSCELVQAMAVANGALREERIEAALARMCADYSEGSWEHLEYLCRTFAHLPLGALDVFRVIAREPAYAVAFAIRAEADVEILCRRFGSELGFVWELTSPREWVEAVQRLNTYYAGKMPQESLANIFPILLEDRCQKLINALPSMSLLIDLAKTAGGCKPADDGLTLNSDQICQRLWKGEESLLQTVLLHGHDGEEWPETRFWEKAMKALLERINGQARAVLKKNITKLLWEDGDFKNSVANIPVICAIWTSSNTQTAWWREGANRLALRKLRAFDPEWFKEAYLAGLRACLGVGLGANVIVRGTTPSTFGNARVFTRTTK